MMEWIPCAECIYVNENCAEARRADGCYLGEREDECVPMKEYIERKSLIEECDDTISNIQFTSPYQDDIDAMVSGIERIRDMIAEIPAADVKPVVHGKWIETGSGTLFSNEVKCSNCGRVQLGETSYCPACGAYMDGGNKNAN